MEIPASGLPGNPAPTVHPILHGIVGVPLGARQSVTIRPARQIMRGGLAPGVLRRVRDHVDAHLGDSISINDLAAIAGLSLYHFARAFKRSEGVNPHSYVMQCRVRRAQELLAGTDMPIAEIAIACGFSDQSHCARRFRKSLGITPWRYRWSTR